MGDKQKVWRTELPSGEFSGRASVAVWRQSPQKLETNVHVDFEIKPNYSSIFVQFYLAIARQLIC